MLEALRGVAWDRSSLLEDLDLREEASSLLEEDLRKNLARRALFELHKAVSSPVTAVLPFSVGSVMYCEHSRSMGMEAPVKSRLNVSRNCLLMPQ